MYSDARTGNSSHHKRRRLVMIASLLIAAASVMVAFSRGAIAQETSQSGENILGLFID